MALDDEGRLRAVASSVVERAGYDLEEFTVVSVGRRQQVRVVIDGDRGVSLDDAARVSRDISARLEEQDADSTLGAYTLEVSSPGVGRALTAERHFRRARGRLVTLTLVNGQPIDGRVLSVSDGTLHLLVGPTGLQPVAVPLDQVTRGRVEVEFNPPPAAVTELLALAASGRPEPDDAGGSPVPASDASKSNGLTSAESNADVSTVGMTVGTPTAGTRAEPQGEEG